MTHPPPPDPRTQLDPDMDRLLRMNEAAGQPKIVDLTPEGARRWARDMFAASDPIRSCARVAEDSIPGPAGDLPVRVYHPAPSEPRPLLVHFHGGGWVLGDLDQADDVCRRLATECDAVVVSVDYRLAPEHPYPAAVEDAIAATAHVAAGATRFGGRSDRIGVSGDSAGGHLAAVAALAMRDRSIDPPLVLQYLIYPVTDSDFQRPSMQTNATGRLLETDGMRWFWDHFCPDLDRRSEWMASPMRVGSVEGTPPALVALAAHDPLFSEGLAYARRLEDAGVQTTVRIARDLIHGYFSLTAASPRADEEVDRLHRVARALLHAD